MKNDPLPNFFTATINNWQYLLKSDCNKQIIIESLKYLKDKNRLAIYAFVIMPNHIHLIWKEHLNETDKERPKAAFFKFTAHMFQKKLEKEGFDVLKKYYVNTVDRKYNFWMEKPDEFELFTRNMVEQKIDYIHNNPSQTNWNLADEPIEYKYSSARFYETGIDDFNLLSHYMDEF